LHKEVDYTTVGGRSSSTSKIKVVEKTKWREVKNIIVLEVGIQHAQAAMK